MLYKLQGLKRIHNDRTVLDIDSLDIADNKIYTLIGPNGAGKTTLLQILAFLDRPSSGAIHFQGELVSFSKKQLTMLRRKVVLLDQAPIMFTGSVWKNVEFGLKVRRVAERQRRQLVNEALELVGMENFGNYHAPGLSGGETKRVALARALALRPEVLLCDEPTANVDNENQEIILKIIKRINRDQKCSIIFATHYLYQAKELADETLVLQHGSLTSIASENTYRATVSGTTGGKLICQLTGQLFLQLPETVVASKRELVKLHVDPARVVLNPSEGELSAGNLVSGHVTELAQDSGRIRVTVNIGVKLNLALPVAAYRRQRPCIGDKVQLFIPHNGVICSDIPLVQG